MADWDIEGVRCDRGDIGMCRRFSVKLLLRLIAAILGDGGARGRVRESRWVERGAAVLEDCLSVLVGCWLGGGEDGRRPAIVCDWAAD
jgi:hypothetical protein